MRFLDLFSGIGGFALGLERAGHQTVAFCEIEPFCRAVLKKHWPSVPCYRDVRELTADRLTADGITVDAICGGFPCQDISIAGAGIGIDGARSELWFEFSRLIGELRPRLVIVENVSALLGRGLGRVLGGLASLRYDAEWHCIPASAIGANHRRDRIWIVAYPEQSGLERSAGAWFTGTRRSPSEPAGGGQTMDDTMRRRHWTPEKEIRPGRHGSLYAGWWSTEPAVGRVANGIPNRVDRIRALGNAVVPQIPEMIGKTLND